jgi:hypothetical protein
MRDFLALLVAAVRNRAIRATAYNEASSRSHLVVTAIVEVQETTVATEETDRRSGDGIESAIGGTGRALPQEGRRIATTTIKRGKLTLVDLAGSERWTTDPSSGASAMTPEHVRELIAINRSLSALGNCIEVLSSAALAEAAHREAGFRSGAPSLRRPFVPYRDSVLTVSAERVLVVGQQCCRCANRSAFCLPLGVCISLLICLAVPGSLTCLAPFASLRAPLWSCRCSACCGTAWAATAAPP